MTDKARPQRRKLVPHKIGPVDKRRRKRGLTVAVKTAIDALMYDRCNRAEACERAGITERSLYLALEKPEVAEYFNAALVLLRQGERPRNIHRLAEIRDAGTGTPAVNAIRALELLAEHDDRPDAPTRRQLPGLVVVINAGASQSIPSQPPIVTIPAERPAKPAFDGGGRHD